MNDKDFDKLIAESFERDRMLESINRSVMKEINRTERKTLFASCAQACGHGVWHSVGGHKRCVCHYQQHGESRVGHCACGSHTFSDCFRAFRL